MSLEYKRHVAVNRRYARLSKEQARACSPSIDRGVAVENDTATHFCWMTIVDSLYAISSVGLG